MKRENQNCLQQTFHHKAKAQTQEKSGAIEARNLAKVRTSKYGDILYAEIYSGVVH